MRSVCTGSFLVCFAGLFLFFAHIVAGQGTRELFGPILGTNPQQNQRTSPPTPAPLPNAPPNSASSTSTPPPSAPIGGGLYQRLISDLPVAANTETTPLPVAVPNTETTRPTADTFTSSVLETETEEEREERDLLLQRQQAEQITDPERREAALEQMVQLETARRNRLARRAINEAGADLFYVPRLKEQYLDTGWCQLFDGYTDFGWKIQNSGHYAGGKFTFGQGEIESDPWNPGMVYTKIPFGDITLWFDYWAEKNSEVLLLMNTPPNPDDLNSSCYTFVLNSKKSNRPRGLLLGRHGYSYQDLRTMRERWDDPANKEKGTWHSVRIRIEEGNIQVWLDRRNAITYFETNPIAAGHIAFLVAEGKARFQNILWQPKRAIPLFDTEGRNDSPWRRSDKLEFVGEHESGFRLLRGSVESTDVFENYVLQMQYYQGDISGRSSLFVRSQPGREGTGYEISLQNFPRQRDRESTVGVDAGSFREIKDARYVRAQDLQWTYLTAVVMDRQLQTWINGVPVCEIEDRRKVPVLTGPFLEPGTIRLSVPEDNSSFQFRRLTISPILP